MSIRNWGAFIKSLWDWTFLEGCFGSSKVSPSDIDGVVEHYGAVLFIETKMPGATIPQGQQLLFDALANLPHCFVLVIWGIDNVPQQAQLWKHWDSPRLADVDSVRRVFSEWWLYAEKKGRDRCGR